MDVGAAFTEEVEDLHLGLVVRVFVRQVHSEAPDAAFAAGAAFFEEWGPRVGLAPAWCYASPEPAHAAAGAVDLFVFLSPG